MTTDLFAPPGGTWHRLSPKYTRVRRLGTLVTVAAVFVPLIITSWIFLDAHRWVTAAIAGLGLVWFIWRWIRARRWVESWGYAERDVDLCITKGLWFKELLIVPFGRMQVVKVSSGPIMRSQGLATVELVTASGLTDATIPGLPAYEAAALRDRMIELSDASRSGL